MRFTLLVVNWVTVLNTVCIVLAWMWFNIDDQRVQREDDALYCHKVHDKAWPDYRRQYDTMCTVAGELKER